jgi:hypothetical protein
MFIEYQIDDETTILIQSRDREETGMVKAALTEEQPEKAAKKFEEALEPVHRVALALRKKLVDLRADETEVTFGLTTTGKLGNFAIAEVGVEANFSVKLKWSNTPKTGK